MHARCWLVDVVIGVFVYLEFVICALECVIWNLEFEFVISF